MKHLLCRSLVHYYRYSVIVGSLFFFSTLLLLTINSSAISNPSAQKVITIKVNQSGIISAGRDTISSDDLANYIRERLFKSYTGTGKMYDAIKLIKDGEPQAIVFEVILKEIVNGQKKALTELCLEKYKKLFENISSRQQAKLKKNFPVLFQTTYD
jgi:hypothetical protein